MMHEEVCTSPARLAPPLIAAEHPQDERAGEAALAVRVKLRSCFRGFLADRPQRGLLLSRGLPARVNALRAGSGGEYRSHGYAKRPWLSRFTFEIALRIDIPFAMCSAT